MAGAEPRDPGGERNEEKTEASARANDLHRLQRERTGQGQQRVCLPRCVLQPASCCRTILKAD